MERKGEIIKYHFFRDGLIICSNMEQQISKISIAIDGPSGAGKSSVAKAIASRFGFIYVDTGAIYRTVGLAVQHADIDSKDREGVISLLPYINIDIAYDSNGVQRMILNKEDVSEEIRTPRSSIYASDVSAIPEVRAFLMDMQRSLAKKYSVIMDGRDIGTVVLPDADLKIFLTASPEIRAQRRFLELCEKGIETSYNEVLKDIEYRDKQDSTRATAPLKPAEDSIYIDCSNLSFLESVDAVAVLIKDKLSQFE